jgi:hypothetical protein
MSTIEIECLPLFVSRIIIEYAKPNLYEQYFDLFQKTLETRQMGIEDRYPRSWETNVWTKYLDLQSITNLSMMNDQELKDWLLFDVPESRRLIELYCRVIPFNTSYSFREHLRWALFMTNVFSISELHEKLMTNKIWNFLIDYTTHKHHAHQYPQIILITNIPWLYEVLPRHWWNLPSLSERVCHDKTMKFSLVKSKRNRKNKRSRKARKITRRQILTEMS